MQGDEVTGRYCVLYELEDLADVGRLLIHGLWEWNLEAIRVQEKLPVLGKPLLSLCNELFLGTIRALDPIVKVSFCLLLRRQLVDKIVELLADERGNEFFDRLLPFTGHP